MTMLCRISSSCHISHLGMLFLKSVSIISFFILTIKRYLFQYFENHLHTYHIICITKSTLVKTSLFFFQETTVYMYFCHFSSLTRIMFYFMFYSVILYFRDFGTSFEIFFVMFTFQKQFVVLSIVNWLGAVLIWLYHSFFSSGGILVSLPRKPAKRSFAKLNVMIKSMHRFS